MDDKLRGMQTNAPIVSLEQLELALARQSDFAQRIKPVTVRPIESTRLPSSSWSWGHFRYRHEGWK